MSEAAAIRLPRARARRRRRRRRPTPEGWIALVICGASILATMLWVWLAVLVPWLSPVAFGVAFFNGRALRMFGPTALRYLRSPWT